MDELFTLNNLFTLCMLVLLQAVLGFDNLLYISIESKRVEPSKQSFVRRAGLAIAIVLRIVLLFVLMSAISYFQNPFFNLTWEGIITGEFTVHSVIVIVGGVFIIYTATKEIFHMMAIDDFEGHHEGATRSVAGAMFWIILMNLIFSFDSILSALALTQVFAIMATAIVISGILMILLVDRVSEFLQKNRMYEVLGLFILFIVGIMLLSEGGHLAHLKLFGQPVEAMAKSTFYFVISVIVIVEIVQSKYKKKLLAEKR